MATAQQQASNVPVNPKLQLINRARDVLRGSRNLNSGELYNLYKELEHNDQFAYATEVLLVKMKMDEDAGTKVALTEYQALARYIYKDHSLPASFKFSKALQELGSHEDLAHTLNCETLGLTGAVYKRKWQFDHQYKNLVLSQHYYKRGYESWQFYLDNLATNKASVEQNDDGYNAVNYAYINELVAIDTLEEYGGITGFSKDTDEKLKEAIRVREYVLKQFVNESADGKTAVLKKDNKSWVVATVAEAFFGLQRYGLAFQFIESYIAREDVQSWEKRTFSQQMFSIAYLQLYQQRFIEKNKDTPAFANTLLATIVDRIKADEIKKCLRLFTDKPPGNPAATAADGGVPEIKKAGKTGLALSGGGFRASLFHIGVLAALAEKDELRNIEIISCVSGGSIIGAFYYLKLKPLLESKTDNDITRDDYIKLVQEIEKEFLEGVQKNLRIRLFSNLICNFKMFRVKKYSRTHRMGELYNKHLFNKVWDSNPAYKKILDNNGGNIYMSDLFITPKDQPVKFDIGRDNWRRKNKIPQLVLNATSVNTGHNWQFTASWMGEPPGNIQADIDVKPRLRRMYYSEAPGKYNKFPLGYAVGASSCVPVMFHPMPLHGLYPDMDLQLIDGGLHDNQGIAALIEQECKNMIISDGSSQLPTNTIATNNEAAVFYRADNILQERLRELQFMDIKERNYTTQLNTLVTVHLKSDLQSNPVSWLYCTDPPRSIVYANTCTDNTDLTKYGLLWDVQSALSEIRTDLDSFSDVEANGLMYSGYAQINYEYSRLKNDTSLQLPQPAWNFLKIKDYVTLPAKAVEIADQLSTGKKLAFKVIDRSLAVKVGAIVLGVLAAIVLLYLGIKFINVTVVTITVKVFVFAFIGFLLGLVSKFIAALFSYKTTLRKYAAFFIVMMVAWVFCNLYIWFFNGVYNGAGKIKE